MTLSNPQNQKQILECPGNQGRVEGATCSLCNQEHAMTFEFAKENKALIREWLYPSKRIWWKPSTWRKTR